MAEKFSLNYFYWTEETADRVAKILDMTGDQEKAFFGQVVRGYFKREHAYYVAALRQDAAARGLDPKSYAAILITGGEKNLPPYTSDRPVFPPSPIAIIPSVQGTEKAVNYLKLNKRNTCLLRVAQIVEGCSLAQLFSRLLVDHFRQHWEKTYLPQFEFEETLEFKS
jgi:hypothetical protein